MSRAALKSIHAAVDGLDVDGDLDAQLEEIDKQLGYDGDDAANTTEDGDGTIGPSMVTLNAMATTSIMIALNISS